MKTDTELFPAWRDKPIDEVLYECRELLEDMDFPTVRQWRNQGRLVAGHFQVYFPEEIAHAAGMLPLKLRGAPVEPTRSDSHFGSYLCSILKTSLELVLSEHVELDVFITHPICDAARNLAGIWSRNFDYPCQILYLPQNPNSSHSVHYLRDEYARVQRVIEEIAGQPVKEDALRESTAIYNRNRALLRELYVIKKDTPWFVTADEAYVLMAIGGIIPREQHNTLLESALPMIRNRPAKQKDRIRVVFDGGFCEQPPLDLIRAIGRSCYVVDDDLLIGLRWILDDVDTTGDILHSLADAYINHSSHSPVQHDLRKPKEQMLLERVKASGATAAIVTAAKMCEPGLEEQVVHTRALDSEGIPYFVTEFEENMSSFDHLEIQLETFVENILFE